METSFRNMAQRIVNAEENFIDSIVEFGYSEQEAVKIFKVFKKAKMIKLEAGIGRYNLQHGSFWDKVIMNNAINYTL